MGGEMRGAMVGVLGLLVVACKAEGPGRGNDDTGADDSGAALEPGYPSSFETGKYRIQQLSLLEDTEGLDFDGDGEVDNNLPNALRPVDLVISQYDLSREGFNATIADAIIDGLLLLLLEARHDSDLQLTIDVMGGTTENGFLQVDPVTLDPQTNEPRYAMHGVFESETRAHTGEDYIKFPITFFPNAPPQLATLDRARFQGTLDGIRIDGLLAGVVPAERLIKDIIEPIIPEQGLDQNGDGVVDLTKDEIMDLVWTLAENENITDIELDDDQRGVSAAFSFTAFVSDWPDP